MMNINPFFNHTKSNYVSTMTTSRLPFIRMGTNVKGISTSILSYSTATLKNTLSYNNNNQLSCNPSSLLMNNNRVSLKNIYRQRSTSHFDYNSVKPVHIFVIDPYVPNGKASILDIFKKDRRRLLMERLQKFALTAYTTYQLRKELGGWKPIKFAEEAQEMYNQLLTAIENNDKETIRKLAGDGLYFQMLSKIKASLKKNRPLNIPKIARFVDRSQVVHKVASKAQTEQNNPQATEQVAQVTVKLTYDQVNRVNPKGLPQRVVEYIILERWINQKDGEWKILGVFRKKRDDSILATE